MAASPSPPPPAPSLLPGIGLALGGGVTYSIAGVGVYQVLAEDGLPVVAVSGTSGGAIVGGAIAAGLSPASLVDLACGLNWTDLVRFSPRAVGVFSGEPIVRFMERATGRRRIEELPLPFTVVCTDILTSTEVRLTAGDLGLAVQASCAIPGLFQPVAWGEHLLVDGGIVDNLPVTAVQDHRPAVVVAVDVLTRIAAYQGRLRSGVQVALKAYHTMVRRLSDAQIRQADLVVQPDMSGCSAMNFRDAATIIERGREATRPLLPRLRAILAERLSIARSLASRR